MTRHRREETERITERGTTCRTDPQVVVVVVLECTDVEETRVNVHKGRGKMCTPLVPCLLNSLNLDTKIFVTKNVKGHGFLVDCPNNYRSKDSGQVSLRQSYPTPLLNLKIVQRTATTTVT